MKIVIFSLLALVFSSVCPKKSHILTVSGEFLYPTSFKSYNLDDMILITGRLAWFTKNNKVDLDQGCISFMNVSRANSALKERIGKILFDSLTYLRHNGEPMTDTLDNIKCKIIKINGLPYKKIFLKVSVVFESNGSISYIESKRQKEIKNITVPVYHALGIEECRCVGTK